MDFAEISNIIEQRREELKSSKTLVEVIDYGAGSPNANRSKEQMQQGVISQLPLASLASIGVKKEKAQQIFEIFKTLKPKRILELGTCCGFSSAYMGFFAPNAKIYTIEGSPNIAKVAKDSHRVFGLDNIKVLVGRFDEVLPKLLKEIDLIDFAFVDGHHDKFATLAYFQEILPFMARGGVMLFDDIAWSAGMKEAWREVLAHNKHKRFQDFGWMGAFMVVKFLDLKKQYLSIKQEIDSAIFRVIQNSAFIGGDEVLCFEKEFAEFLGEGVKTLGVGNGTDALEIAIESLNLPQGGEVLIPANTFVATAEAVVRNGLKVVFVDCGRDYTLDIGDLESKITPASVAIIAVHLYGQSAKLNEILNLAKKYHLKVIEDCAQSHGATYNGRRVGTFGDVGAFSFYPGKNLGAFGDGGMIVSRDFDCLQRCREIAHHGGLSKYEHRIIGRNSRLDGMQAAILRVKLKYLESWNARRREIAGLYLEGLGDMLDIALPEVKPSCICVWHLFVIRTLKRQTLMEVLRKNGIEYGLHYPLSLPNTPAYAPFVKGIECKNATCWEDEILSLPMGEHLEDKEVQKVIEVLKDTLCG